jgi:hypothetical protein
MNTTEKKPYIDRFGLARVPYQPKHQYDWELLGFVYDRENQEMARSVSKPFDDGKVYSPASVLKAAVGKWNKWGAHTVDWKECAIEPRRANPFEKAQVLFDLHAKACWGLKQAYADGWPHYSYAGAVKNEFAVQDRATRRALQRIAKDWWEEYKHKTRQAIYA